MNPGSAKLSARSELLGAEHPIGMSQPDHPVSVQILLVGAKAERRFPQPFQLGGVGCGPALAMAAARGYSPDAEAAGTVTQERHPDEVGREIPETGNVTIRYATDSEGVKEEEFDLVVLGVGLAPPAKVNALAATFGIELSGHGFCKTNPANPIETTRPGIYVESGTNTETLPAPLALLVIHHGPNAEGLLIYE